MVLNKKFLVFLIQIHQTNSVEERKGTSKPKIQNIIYSIRNHFILKIFFFNKFFWTLFETEKKKEIPNEKKLMID